MWSYAGWLRLTNNPPAQGYYNCSELSRASYDVVDQITHLIGNAAPYCAEMYNAR